MKMILATVVVCILSCANGANIQDTVANRPELSSLGTLLSDNDLLDTLNGLDDVTIFAPTNDAFDAAQSDLEGLTSAQVVAILQYHVIAEDIPSSAITNELTKATVNGANIRFNIYKDNTVYTAQGSVIDLDNVDIAIDNGKIHIVNSVLQPVPTQDIFDRVADDSSFSKLAGAVGRANLETALRGGPLTVFAPNNNAEDSDLLDDLSGTDLTSALQYHVVSGTFFSAALESGMTIPTLEGSNLKVFIDDTGVYINCAKVQSADVPVTNGVVHVVNRVLKTDDDVPDECETSGAFSVIYGVKTTIMVVFASLLAIHKLL